VEHLSTIGQSTDINEEAKIAKRGVMASLFLHLHRLGNGDKGFVNCRY